MATQLKTKSGERVGGSCVLLGSRAVLIRGPSGSGRSTLALSLIEQPAPFTFARLVCDDYVIIEAQDGRLLARPVDAIAGLIEIRGLGIAPFPYAPVARIGLVADLTPADEILRLPEPEDLRAEILGVTLPRLAVPAASPLASRLVVRAMAHLASGGKLTDFAGGSA